MERYTGKSIFKKIAIGKFFYEKDNYIVKRVHTEDAGQSGNDLKQQKKKR